MKNKLFEVFYIGDLPEEEQNKLYSLYKDSYEKNVGTAWSPDSFFDRAYDWEFFGDENGYVSVRVQDSGLYKLAVVAGSPKSILKGMHELMSLNEPTWGMVSKDLLPMLKKLGFKSPNSFIFNTISKMIPKSVFGDTEFNINSDNSITFKYGDVGTATKYFVGNQKYYDWLKAQVKGKVNPMKLSSILKEVINEASQRGELYHFTPIGNLEKLLKSQYIIPNAENQISTSIRPNMQTSWTTGDNSSRINNDMSDSIPVVRLTLDGDKITNKYKVKPWAWDEEDLGEEQIIVNGKNFYFMPYLKRIDIFKNGSKGSKSKKITAATELLKSLNIPYEVYNDAPEDNTPYLQTKKDYLSSKQYTPKKQTKSPYRKTYYEFPESLVVDEADLPYLAGSDITKIPDNLTVNGDFDLSSSKIEVLPNNLTVNGELDISGTNVKVLPQDLKVESLRIYNTKISELPSNIKKYKTLNISNSQIKSLPNNLTVKYLTLYNVDIKTLPNKLTVDGFIHASDSKLESIPSDIKLDGNILLNRTPISKKYSAEEIKRMCPGIKGDVEM